MSILLENEKLKLEIQHPGEVYQGSRFDWCGQISQITFEGRHTFCTTENLEAESLKNIGIGLYNEFGFNTALAYEECHVGDQFHKIGVGLLTKACDEAYRFSTVYEVEPLDFLYNHNGNSIIFTVYSPGLYGYAYSLIKKIELLNSSFKIDYQLTNTGEKPFSNTEYVHNFLSINQQRIGNDYELRFSFEIDPSGFDENVNPNQNVTIGEKTLNWKQQTKEPFFFSEMGTTKKTYWQLEHQTERLGIREIANFDVLRVNVWGTAHVVSPEIYYSFQLEPKETAHWVREYEIYHL